jgi:hypothetical protein
MAALAALLVVATAFAPAVGAAVGDGGTVPAVDVDNGNDTESADEAYVTEGGDVVLVYDYNASGGVDADGDTARVTTIEVDDDEYESEDDEYEEYEPEEAESVGEYGSGDDERESPFADAEVSGHAGVNVTAGLAHVVAEADGVDSNVTGDGTVWVTADGATANATVSAPRPDHLESLALDAEMTDTLEERSSSLSVDATVALPGNASVLALLEEARLSGSTTTTPTTFQSNGSVAVETGLPLEMDRSHSVELTQADGGYTLDAAAEYSPGTAENWDSREAARETLSDRFCLNGTECDVTVESYAFDDGRLDVEYTVTLPEAADRVPEMVRAALTGAEGVENATADSVADRLDGVTVERIAADLSVADGDGELTYDVAIAGTDDLVLAGAEMLDVVGNASVPATGQATPVLSPTEIADRLRTTVDARAAADATETRSWDATLTTDGDTATVAATVESDAPQWGAYVEELTDRGVNVSGATEASLTAATDGDRVVVDAEATYTEDEWLDELLSSLPADANGTVDALRAAAFDRARADWELTESSARLEAAVAVENASALRAELPDRYGDIDATYTDFAEERTTVRLNGVVDGDADESDVRALSLVGEDTDVTLAADHDREFERMNRTAVRSYLGYETESGTDGISPLMVAGGVAAVGAVGGAGVLARRYW